MAKKGKKNIKSQASKGQAMSFSPYAHSAPFGTGQPPPRGAAPTPKQQITKENIKKSKANKKNQTDPDKKAQKQKEKRIKKGRDYFFVMRKIICFLMFLLFAACILLFVIGYINLLPEYTSLYIEPDYTPKEERIIEVDGEIIKKPDESVHFSTVDPIFGFIKKITGKDMGASPKYDLMAEKVEAGVSDMISSIAMTYYPIAIILFIVIAFISMIKAFLAMFGKRIFRLFGLSSFWMIVFALVIVIGGVASNMAIDESLDFTQIVPFLTAALVRPIDGPVTAAGLSLLAMIVIPISTLILSMFAKKKIPYSIFD